MAVSVEPPPDALSVGQLYRRSKNALARDFRGAVWVTGEIKSMREMRGNLYLVLVEPGDHVDGSDISVDVACWSRQRALVQAQLAAAGIKLASGMIVRVQGTVTLSKFGKLQVELTALDTEALIGRQAADKRRLLGALAAEGLLERNRRLPSPLVPLRVGLVSSEGSEGYNDFVGQLDRSGYAFAVTFVHSPVQGPAAPTALARALGALADSAVDVIAVVRGGGGELDAFDKEVVARAIATSPVPVWTGIGHTGDRAVADEVAHRSFITPTECGQALVGTIGAFASRVDNGVQRLHRLTERAVDAEGERIRALGRHLASATRASVDKAQSHVHGQAERARRSTERDVAIAMTTVDGYAKDVRRAGLVFPQDAARRLGRLAGEAGAAAERRLAIAEQDSRVWSAQISGLDPRRQLRRGYSLTRTADGRLVKDVGALSPGDAIVTTFASGEASSTVTSTDRSEEAP